jgi:hypothetical protein
LFKDGVRVERDNTAKEGATEIKSRKKNKQGQPEKVAA